MASEKRQNGGEALPAVARERLAADLGRLAHEYANVVTVLVMRLTVLANDLPADAAQLREDVAAAMRATEEARALTARLKALGRTLAGDRDP